MLQMEAPAPGHLEIGSGSRSGERGTGPFADHPAADLIPESPWDIGDTNLHGGTVHDRRRPADMPEKITWPLDGLLKMRWGWVTFEQSWRRMEELEARCTARPRQGCAVTKGRSNNLPPQSAPQLQNHT